MCGVDSFQELLHACLTCLAIGDELQGFKGIHLQQMAERVRQVFDFSVLAFEFLKHGLGPRPFRISLIHDSEHDARKLGERFERFTIDMCECIRCHLRLLVSTPEIVEAGGGTADDN